MRTFIIGGGIAGLVAALYFPDSYLFSSEEIGGQMRGKTFPLGPRILKGTHHSAQFMKDIGLGEDPMCTFFTAYKDKQRIYTKLSEKLAKKYATKTGRPDAAYKVGNNGENLLEGWPIDSIIMDALLNKVRSQMVRKKVTKIDTKGRCLYFSNGDSVYYTESDRVISTIPLPMLWSLCGESFSEQLNYLPKHFYLVNEKMPEDYLDFIYVLDNSPWHRMTRHGDMTVYEANKDISMDLRKHGKEIMDNKTILIGQIIGDLNAIVYEGIYLLGRFSQWSHSIRTAEVIARVKEDLIERTSI